MRYTPGIYKADSHAVGFAVSWKSPFQRVRRSLCPRNVGNWSHSCLRMCRSSLQDLSGGVPRFVRGPVARNRRRHFFDRNEVNITAVGDRIEKYVVFDPIGRCNHMRSSWVEKMRTAVIVCGPVGSKKCGRQFPVSGCPEKRNTPPCRSWREI